MSGGSGKNSEQRHSKARVANGVISAVIVCFFVIHGCMGSISAHMDIPHTLAWLSFVGTAFVVAHIIACIVTSREQLTDTVRPPSARKKRHLLFKWITGGVLALCVVVHVSCRVLLGSSGAVSDVVQVVTTVVLAAAVAVHICFGAKSFTRDLNLSSSFRMPFRVVLCAFAAVFSLAMVTALL